MTTERKAICLYCKTERLTSEKKSLAFFEDQSDKAKVSQDTCGNCRYAEMAHTDEIRNRKHNAGRICNNFVPRGGLEHDYYYCGCRGWD